jgi:hypothetical protein
MGVVRVSVRPSRIGFRDNRVITCERKVGLNLGAGSKSGLRVTLSYLVQHRRKYPIRKYKVFKVYSVKCLIGL